MRKIMILALVTVFTLSSAPKLSAMEGGKGLYLGARLGFNYSSLTGSSGKLGYQAMMTVDYAFDHNHHIMSGVQYAVRKTKDEEHVPLIEASLDWKSEAVYIMIPIHYGYKLHLTGVTKLVFTAGPYFAYGIAGKVKGRSTTLWQDYRTFSKMGLKRFDMGLGISAGIELYNTSLTAGYDWGVLDISQGVKSVRQRNFYMGLGYKFSLSNMRK